MRALGVRNRAAESDARCGFTASACTVLTERAAALDMGNAGTAMRLFTGLLAAQAFRFATDRR